MTERFVQRSSVISSPDPEGGGVLLSVDGGMYYALNNSGWHVWQELAEPVTANALSDALAEAFAVDHAQARRDVDAIVKELRRRDLIEQVS